MDDNPPARARGARRRNLMTMRETEADHVDGPMQTTAEKS